MTTRLRRRSRKTKSRADDFQSHSAARRRTKYERPGKPETPEKASRPTEPQAAEGRNVHAVNAMDLTRLSIDNDGRLYWDGKPVEVRRRLMMSRGQVVGASLIAFFIVVGAIGSVLQATATRARMGLPHRPGAANAPTPPAAGAPDAGAASTFQPDATRPASGRRRRWSPCR